MDTITRAIGVYGDREVLPVWIHWGNGITLRHADDHATGTPMVADWIFANCVKK